MASILQYIHYVFQKIFSSTVFKAILGLCGITIGYFWQLPIMQKMIPVIALFLIDTFLGTWVVIRNKKFNWNRFFAGLIRLVLYAILLVICSLVDNIFVSNIFTDLALGFVVGTEFLSILKNMSKLGSKFPRFLMKKLKEMIETEFKVKK